MVAYSKYLAAILFCSWCTVSLAATYYVSGTTGNDSWSGTLPDPNGGGTDGPWLTLLHAQTVMRGSATKQTTLRGGTYVLTADLSFTSADTGETWIAAPGETVILDGATTYTLTGTGANTLTFQGLTFQNLIAGGIYLKSTGSTLRWNVFLNCVNQCFRGDNFDNGLIDSNTVDGQSPGNPPGDTSSSYSAVELSFGSSGNTVSHNLIQNAEGGGIAFMAGPTDPPCNNNMVDRNIIRASGINVIDNGALYMMDRSHSATGNQIINNLVDSFGGYVISTTTLIDNQTKGIYLDDEMSNVVVSCNICRACGDYAIQYHGGDNNLVTNNIFHLSAGGNEIGLYQTVTGGTVMSGNTFTNNLVYSSGAYHNPLWQVSGSPENLPTDNTNLYFSATGAPIPNTGVVDTNRILADPQFTNAATGDYSMPGASPAFTDAGFVACPTDQGPLPQDTIPMIVRILR